MKTPRLSIRLNNELWEANHRASTDLMAVLGLVKSSRKCSVRDIDRYIRPSGSYEEGYKLLTIKRVVKAFLGSPVEFIGLSRMAIGI